MEFRYVMANNPGLDPNDGDAYAAARDNLRAKIEKGGVTINMPTGVGEYTGQTDKQFGYDKTRAARAAAAMAQLQNTAGVTNSTGFLLGMNTITGRQPLNLTPAQAFEMEKALAKIAPEVRAEREAAARQAQFEIARSAYMWQQAGQFTLNATAGVLNNIATTLYAVPAPGIAYTTNAMAATAYTNAAANARNWYSALQGEFTSYPSVGKAVSDLMPEDWGAARGLAQGIDSMPMASGMMLSGSMVAAGSRSLAELTTGGQMSQYDKIAMLSGRWSQMSTQGQNAVNWSKIGAELVPYGTNMLTGGITSGMSYIGGTTNHTWGGLAENVMIGMGTMGFGTPLSGPTGSILRKSGYGLAYGMIADTLAQGYQNDWDWSQVKKGQVFGAGLLTAGGVAFSSHMQSSSFGAYGKPFATTAETTAGWMAMPFNVMNGLLWPKP
ncbi:hypothetical protein [Turneriella parva]|uniref:Uncharacterized protein n=1 Tax=Turneriella parva (strain ATCC BAA-1111 / DSM 21527 / NCTC 11395 / H) TaxID=869212 RepID=I4B4B4_TURPD|nr:hypothetical protein [Turneriella parva]AFM12121.1 hypothetical protein Turpa_1473 [Turneriella parva DSM 21527]